MYIVSESGNAIFNINTSTIISIYKFESGGETKWAVCADYPADGETYHLLTNKTENREIAVDVLKHIVDAIGIGKRILDLSTYHPNSKVKKSNAKPVDLVTYYFNHA